MRLSVRTNGCFPTTKYVGIIHLDFHGTLNEIVDMTQMHVHIFLRLHTPSLYNTFLVYPEQTHIKKKRQLFLLHLPFFLKVVYYCHHYFRHTHIGILILKYFFFVFYNE